MAFDIGAGFAGIGSDPMNPIGGFIGGALFGGKQKFDMSGINDVITQRQAQIDQFANQLEMARGNVLSNYQNLNANTMKNFMPQYEAMLNGRGLNVQGGAYASGVGRQAAGLQSNYDMLNSNMTENNLNTIANMRASLFGSQLAARQFGDITNFNLAQGYNKSMAQGIGGLGNPMGVIGPLFGGGNGQTGMMSGSAEGNNSIAGFGGYGGFQGTNSSMATGRNIYSSGGSSGGMGAGGFMKLLSMFA